MYFVLMDSWTQWCYNTRNVFGFTNGNKSVEVLYAKDNERYNTVNDIDGYFKWSAGFTMSASKDGCFAYQANGETRYFDISLKALLYW